MIWLSGEIPGCIFFFALVTRWVESSLFYIYMPFSYCMICVQMCILAFGMVFLIQKQKSICATYNICSKVILTEIFEGPCSTNNIDFYSSYVGDIMVSLSFLVLTCKTILWQKSNLSDRKDFFSESLAFFESFYYQSASSFFSLRAGQWASLTAALSGISGQRTSIVEATLYTISRQEMLSASEHSKMQMCLSGYTMALWMYLLSG